MNTLSKIQKFFHIFGIFIKIAYVFSIVGAVFCAVGALCVVAGIGGGQAFTLFGKPVIIYESSLGANQTLAVMLSSLLFLVTDAILLGLANQYIKREQAQGTPFTQAGADYLKKLGISCIWMPIVTTVVVQVVLVCLKAEQGGDLSNLPSVGTGVLLILTSLIFRYGAQLEADRKA